MEKDSPTSDSYICGDCGKLVPVLNQLVHSGRCSTPESKKRKIESNDDTNTPTSSSAGTIWSKKSSSELPSCTSWDRIPWLWSYCAGGEERHRNAEDDDGAYAYVVNAYEDRLKHDRVANGALGSRELFDTCKLAIDFYPQASTSGKWLVFASGTYVDYLWMTISAAVKTGKLGPTAKVGRIRNDPTDSSKDRYLICVYTNDFRDMDNISQVFAALNGLITTAFMDSEASGVYYYYKADIVTGAFANRYKTSSIENGTFYQGFNGVVSHPDHFKENGGKGSKVRVKV